jgi:hypothetical protein
MRLLLTSFAACVLLSLATLAHAQQPNKNDQPARVDLLVSPAPEPSPALRYRLSIGVRERSPGNGATFYHRALLFRRSLPEAHGKQFVDKMEAWFDGPMSDQQATEMKQWLEGYSSVFRELKTAVYREHCDWDLRLQDVKGMDAIAFLLPEVQDLRDVARALRVKARVEIFEGRFDDAVETIRWGLQLGRDAAQQETLISNLVGIAITAQMMEPLTELIRAPNSPNMYWAIATLPQPFIDIRHALEFERGFPEQIFPFLKDAEKADRSPQEWQRLLEVSLGDVHKLSATAEPQDETQAWLQPLGMTLMLVRWYPLAKAELIADGMDPQKVEAMPVAQVVAVHASRSLNETYDKLYKTTLLPYDEGLAMMQAMESELARKRQGETIFLGTRIGDMLIPSTVACKRAEMRIPRHFAALQAIEAIRMHAAQSGKLPHSLREVTVVPVPVNPVNHQPFPYMLNGDEAVLEMPITLGEQPGSQAKRFHLRLGPGK